MHRRKYNVEIANVAIIISILKIEINTDMIFM